jgi:hypothetical protein
VDARQYNTMLNTVMYGFGSALNNLVDLNMVRLVVRQMGESLLNSEYGPKFLASMGFKEPEGKDVKTLVKAYADEFKKSEITRTFDVLDVNDDQLVVDIGMCVFASATSAFRAEGVKIPPCPIVGILMAGLNKKLRVNGGIKAAEYKPEKNSTVFTIDLYAKH